MSSILLTQTSTPVFGWVVSLLGLLMNGIFTILNMIGIPNIGLSIIIFTVVIYMLMTPLTIKQQKFSKLSAKMNPELNAIRDKYKGKSDNESMMAMNAETKAVYAKYGVSPTGSCLQLAIQMPILLALYRVIYNMPAYVSSIRDAFFPLVDNLIQKNGSAELLKSFSVAVTGKNNLVDGTLSTQMQNLYIDVLNKASTSEWQSISNQFSDLANDVTNTMGKLEQFNNFLGLNIGNTPWYTLQHAISDKNYLLVIGAVIIPVLSALTQWVNVKLMPQPGNTNTKGKSDNSTADSMAQSMKTMNTIMPLMSCYFCFVLPAGMGLYWVAGAVIRSIQQIVVNKHLDKMNVDEIIKKNADKYQEKIKKQGIDPNKLSTNAKLNTKKAALSETEKEEAYKKAVEYNNYNAKPGSLAAKANMVKKYNEKNNK